MSDLKKSRAVRRGALAKAYGDLGVLLTEDEYDAAISERENLKMLYLEFTNLTKSLAMLFLAQQPNLYG